ncbi:MULTISPECIES: DUF4040 domain-containing protein [Halolamina]|uniref:Multicomponent Na+:H+ antiporter subunit B n=1 Tax=Halolamina pelagica TaxID=699431 RepID=A0A1I5SZ40_9EURY|nr:MULTISPECIES: DUF4040 domain-containing protein [Halolamina]NHX36915.1 DUF4040 domain-containing protein [Halolamina sp. R1-12]SFP75707.1 multicomponent Na+:H+ antiporter subunit B [Halolamina pelagica]
MTPLELSVLALIVGAAFATAALKSVLNSVVAFGAYSLSIAIIWVFLRAPDVGLTEAAVGAGIMTVLFLLTIVKTAHPDVERTFERIDLKAAGVALALVLVLSSTLFALPAVGDANSAVADDEVTEYYLENAYGETDVKNAVTAVLAAYRGFDTMGEAAVVYSAGVGLLVVLNREVFG